MSQGSTDITENADYDALLDLTTNPADRLWRYPLSHAIVRVAARTPLTPNHVTLFHTALGVAAGYVITLGTPRAWVLAGVMFEVRAVLDCVDGGLARAKKLSSPLGRALDQLGDTVGFVSLLAGAAVCLARVYGTSSAVAVAFITALLGANGTAAWDFFKRRFSSLLKDGHDASEAEYLSLCRDYHERGGALLWFSRFVATWQWLTLSPATLGRLRARVARGDWSGVDAQGRVTASAQRLREAARRNDPELRGVLLRVGFVSADALFLLLTLGLLVGQLLNVLPLVMAYAVATWVVTVVSANRLLHEAGERTGEADTTR